MSNINELATNWVPCDFCDAPISPEVGREEMGLCLRCSDRFWAHNCPLCGADSEGSFTSLCGECEAVPGPKYPYPLDRSAGDLVAARLAAYWVTPRSVELLKLAQWHTPGTIDLAELTREVRRTVEIPEDRAALSAWAYSRLIFAGFH